MGRVNVSWRWELGAPLVLVGSVMAALTVGVRGGGLLFWVGVGLAAVGAALFTR